MLPMIALLLVFQLAGEATRHALALPIPGPVLGMLGLLLALSLRGAWRRWRHQAAAEVPAALEQVATTLLGHLSLLFVPAGVGVVTHLSLLASEAVPLGAALVASTLLAVAVGGWLMVRALRRPAP